MSAKAIVLVTMGRVEEAIEACDDALVKFGDDTAPETVARAKTVRLTVSFEDEAGVVQTEEKAIEVEDLANVRSLAVDLKIALE